MPPLSARAAVLTFLAINSVHAAAASTVIAVAPSGPTVPERLLRISVSFAAPVGGLKAALFRRNGHAIEGALLDQPLWSPDRRTATLLLDPGRVKTGLIAHETAGWALKPGEAVTLRIDGRAVHDWRIRPGGCVVPNPSDWVIAAPKAGTPDPLSLTFPGAIDAMSRGLIAVADGSGRRVRGVARLTDGERRWVFAPSARWAAGTWQVVVHPRLENPCGDEPGEAFEHEAGQGLRSERADLRRGFSIN